MVIWPVLLILASLTIPAFPVCVPPMTSHWSPSFGSRVRTALMAIAPYLPTYTRDAMSCSRVQGDLSIDIDAQHTSSTHNLFPSVPSEAIQSTPCGGIVFLDAVKTASRFLCQLNVGILARLSSRRSIVRITPRHSLAPARLSGRKRLERRTHKRLSHVYAK